MTILATLRLTILTCVATAVAAAPAAASAVRVDSSWVARADLLQQRAATDATESLPIGNGDIGAAVWQAEGLTAQLNRTGQFPQARSAGWLVVPSLSAMTAAPDFGARLDLRTGTLVLAGGGRRARMRVDAVRDQVVLEAEGFGDAEQTAELRLWEGRQPEAFAGDGVAALAEQQVDERALDGPRRSGALAAMAAPGASAVRAERVDRLRVRLRFRPRQDGSFRLVVGVPSWTGEDVAATATRAVAEPDGAEAAHRRWWSRYWTRATPLRLRSADGAAEYLEALRTLWLYTTASSTGSGLPNTHGGVANLFAWTRDAADWSPVGYWHYNQRQAAYAALGAGVPELDESYFRLYRERLEEMTGWTRRRAPGLSGTCVSEVLRYDGAGDGDPAFPDCDTKTPPSFHARLISTGPEVAYNAWLRYRYSGDEAFLRRHWAFIRETTRFLVEYGRRGADQSGTLHTDPSNGLETYWDTRDPASDVAALRVMVPLTARIARLLGEDEPFARELDALAGRLPELAAVPGGPLLAAARFGPPQNFEPVATEPIWPWGLFGDTGEERAVGRRTYDAEVLGRWNSWSMLPVVAARLGMADAVRSELERSVQDFQIHPNGFALFMAPSDALRARYVNPYLELGGATAATLQDALVQAYDGTLRIAPAWPRAWAADGEVAIEGGHRVAVSVREGRPTVVVIRPGSDEDLRLRSPWTGEEVPLSLRRGREVTLRPASGGGDDVVVDGTAAKAPRQQGRRSLGLVGAGRVPDGPVAVACVSRRSVTVRVPRALGGRARSVTLIVGGRRVRTIRDGRRELKVDLRGRTGRARVAVQLRVRLRSGRTVVVRRSFATCTPRAAR